MKSRYWDFDQCYGMRVYKLGGPILEGVAQVPPTQGFCRGQEGLPMDMAHAKSDVILGTYQPELSGAGLEKGVSAPACLEHHDGCTAVREQVDLAASQPVSPSG